MGAMISSYLIWVPSSWFFFFSFAAIGFFFSSAFCLAWLDIHPWKRILIFQVAGSILLCGLTYAGILVGNELTQMAVPFPPMEVLFRNGLVGFAATSTLSWFLWLLRIQRGWRVSKNNFSESTVTFESGHTELVWLLVSVVITVIPLGLVDVYSQTYYLVSLTYNLILGAIFVVPLAYFMMRTRLPLIAGLGLSALLPLIALASGIGFYLDDFVEFGLIHEVPQMIAVSILGVFAFPCLFLVAMRWSGFELNVVKDWRNKKRAIRKDRKQATKAPAKHPLDD
jgi:hypothetical protein